MCDSTLILASSSAQRGTLLAQLGVAFGTVACPIEEPRWKLARVSPAAWAMSLAYFKAAAVAAGRPGRVVLGADTVVACGKVMLGKPADIDDARRMLRMQIGRETDVITGIALVRFAPEAAGRTEIAAMGLARLICGATTRVWMRNAPAYVEEYLASGDWAGKAGAYGIQNTGDRLVERIEGSFSNVVGLPVELVGRILPRFDACFPMRAC